MFIAVAAYKLFKLRSRGNAKTTLVFAMALLGLAGCEDGQQNGLSAPPKHAEQLTSSTAGKGSVDAVQIRSFVNDRHGHNNLPGNNIYEQCIEHYLVANANTDAESAIRAGHAALISNPGLEGEGRVAPGISSCRLEAVEHGDVQRAADQFATDEPADSKLQAVCNMMQHNYMVEYNRATVKLQPQVLTRVCRSPAAAMEARPFMANVKRYIETGKYDLHYRGK